MRPQRSRDQGIHDNDQEARPRHKPQTWDPIRCRREATGRDTRQPSLRGDTHLDAQQEKGPRDREGHPPPRLGSDPQGQG